MNPRNASILAACALAVAGAAQAQPTAYTTQSVHLRAGPARAYPVVAVLPPRTRVTVYGCITDYRWCDVASGYDRGWVYAHNLAYMYDEREMILPGVAALAGIAIVGFILDDYWHEHYRDRSWWPERRRWVRPPPPPPPQPRLRERLAPPPAQVQPRAPAPPPRTPFGGGTAQPRGDRAVPPGPPPRQAPAPSRNLPGEPRR